MPIDAIGSALRYCQCWYFFCLLLVIYWSSPFLILSSTSSLSWSWSSPPPCTVSFILVPFVLLFGLYLDSCLVSLYLVSSYLVSYFGLIHNLFYPFNMPTYQMVKNDNMILQTIGCYATLDSRSINPSGS